MRWGLFCLLIVGVVPFFVARAADETRIPLEAFGSLPRIESPLISHDGRYLAYLRPFKGRQVLGINDLTAGNKPSFIFGYDPDDNDKNIEIGWFRWINATRLIVSINAPTRRGVFLTPTVDTRLVALDADGGNMRMLLRQDRFDYQSQSRDDVVAILPDDPDHILMQFAPNDGPPGVYKVNVQNDRRSKILASRNGIYQWYADWQGIVRLGRGYAGETQIKMLARRRPEDPRFETLFKLDPYESDGYRVAGFANATSVYVVSAHATGRDGIYLFDLARDAFAETVFEHDEVDVDGVLFTPRGKALAVEYTDKTFAYHYLDPGFARLHADIDEALPETIDRIVSVTPDERFWIIYSSSSRHPPHYAFFDAEKHVLTHLGNAYPALDPSRMAPVYHVVLQTRNGLGMRSYLTLPGGAQARGLPFVILPHGGPYARDTAHFDYWAQFLASRGYGVIQPNFRGSTGYGNAFVTAGYGEWGRAMQDDVTDATKWVIEKGFADPERICIVGASYGGYAALMGVVREPTLYRCAVSLNGVTDMPRMFLEGKQYIGGSLWLKAIRPNDDEVSLKMISPRHNADKIKVPVLLIQGDIDRSVSLQHGRAMADALSKAGVVHDYIEQEDGDHFLSSEANRLQFLDRLERFLKAHIGAG